MNKIECLNIYYTESTIRNLVPKFYQVIKIDNDEVFLIRLGTNSKTIKSKNNLTYVKHTPKTEYGGNFYLYKDSELLKKLMNSKQLKAIKKESMEDLHKYEKQGIITMHGSYMERA